MKTYFVDANIFLRFILEDNKKLAKKAKEYFQKAKEEKINLIFTPEIIMEINYVLLKVYSVDKIKVIDYLSTLIKTPYLEIINRKILLNCLDIYQKYSIDFIDALLFSYAKENKSEVLSFDSDFKKLPS